MKLGKEDRLQNWINTNFLLGDLTKKDMEHIIVLNKIAFSNEINKLPKGIRLRIRSFLLGEALILTK